jgi:predicted nucleotidyltransferase
MRFDRAVDDLFATASFAPVLRALVGLPSGFGVSAREIGRRAGVTHPTASKVLGSLAEQGLVFIRRSQTGDEFAVNRDHLLAQAVLPLFELERSARSDLITFLARSLRRHAPDLQAAYLFGSAAWGEMEPGSDLDLGVICPPPISHRVERALAKIAQEVRSRYGNRLTWMVGDQISIAASSLRSRRTPPIWRRILKEGIPIPIRASSEDEQDA